MKPTQQDVFKVVAALSEVVPFFPKDSLALDLVSEAVAEFVGTQEQLDWFVRAAIRSISKFDGVPQLRALFCSKYEPADGIQPLVVVDGLGPRRLEADYELRVMRENEARLELYRRSSALSPPEDREPLPSALAPPDEDREPLPLPELKALPAGELLSEAEAVREESARIECPWCRLGYARVRSSIFPFRTLKTGDKWFNFVHTDTEVGRVVCKARHAAGDASEGPAPDELAAHHQLDKPMEPES